MSMSMSMSAISLAMDGTLDIESWSPASAAAEEPEPEDKSMISRLIQNRDLLPLVLAYLDTRSLLALTSTSTRLRRDLLGPATAGVPILYNCLSDFLQARTIVCPMVSFESLGAFLSKYRNFRPQHLHFTYSERHNLANMTPSVPVFNSKLKSPPQPSASPLLSSHLYGVNQSITVNITSSNSLSQVHHPLPEPTLSPIATDPETSDLRSTTGSRTRVGYNVGAISGITASLNSLGSSNSSDQGQGASILNGESDGPNNSNSVPSATAKSSSTSSSSSSSSSTTSSTSSSSLSMTPNTTGASASALSPLTSSLSLSGQASATGATGQPSSIYTAATSSATPILSQTLQMHSSIPEDHHHHRPSFSSSNPIDIQGADGLRSSSSMPAITHGFELSYWQKFALNELFTRSLPFLQTLTIGRTDKPQRPPKSSDRSSTELSAGVCFFLARCFNVMHDMPDTALEKVFWMDVSSPDVVLLIAMIELRDIIVDDRYWRRGYWTQTPLALSPGSRHDDILEEEHDEWDNSQQERRPGAMGLNNEREALGRGKGMASAKSSSQGSVNDTTPTWHGFYYLLFQDQQRQTEPSWSMARQATPGTPLASSSSSSIQSHGYFKKVRSTTSGEGSSTLFNNLGKSSSVLPSSVNPTMPSRNHNTASNNNATQTSTSTPSSRSASMRHHPESSTSSSSSANASAMAPSAILHPQRHQADNHGQEHESEKTHLAIELYYELQRNIEDSNCDQ